MDNVRRLAVLVVILSPLLNLTVNGACQAGEFECDNGDCIPESKQCDDSFDCDDTMQDTSDEVNCTHANPCTEGEVKCHDGTCVTNLEDCPQTTSVEITTTKMEETSTKILTTISSSTAGITQSQSSMNTGTLDGGTFTATVSTPSNGETDNSEFNKNYLFLVFLLLLVPVAYFIVKYREKMREFIYHLTGTDAEQKNKRVRYKLKE